MKNRIVAIIAAVVLIVGVVAFIGMSQAEKRTAGMVRTLLEDQGMTVGDLKFSFMGKKLEARDLQYTWDLKGIKVVSRVERLTMEGFNEASLKPTAGTQPSLVADTINLENASVDLSMNALTMEMDYERVTVKGWRQNLGALMALYDKEGFSTAFFEEMYRFRMEDLEYVNMRYTLPMSGMGTMTSTTARMGLLAPVGYTDSDPQGGRRMSSFADNTYTQTDMGFTQSVGRLEYRDMVMPSARSMGQMMELLTPFIESSFTMKNPSYRPNFDQADVEKMLWDLWELLKEDYKDEAPFGAILMRDFKQDMNLSTLVPGADDMNFAMSIDELEMTMKHGVPMHYALRLAGLNLPDMVIPQEYKPLLDAWFGGMPPLDFAVEVGLATAKQGLTTARLETAVPDLGRTNVAFEGLLELDSLMDIFTVKKLEDVLAVGKVEAELHDNGLLAFMLSLAAQEQGRSLQSMVHEAQTLLNQGVNMPGIQGQLAQGFSDLLEKPGTLRLTMEPNKAVPLAFLAIGLLMDPASLNINIETEPGAKALMEYVPQSLR